MSLFGQGLNSVTHTTIGALTAFAEPPLNTKLALLFFAYQITEHLLIGEDDRIDIDITEFLLGLTIGSLINLFGNVH